MPNSTDQGKNKLFLPIALLFCYLFFYVGIVLQQRSLMYFPEQASYPASQSAISGTQSVVITADDGIKTDNWLKEADDSAKPYIISFYGNASSVLQMSYKMRFFTELGYGALMCGYRGYSGNEGLPSEQGFYKDGRACINYLINEKNINPDNIVIYGESIGSGTATQMATEFDNLALILEVPFDSAVNLAKHKFMNLLPFLSYFMKDKYENYRKIDRINSPVLIMLAGKDRIVPSKFGENLYNHAIEPKKIAIFERSGHNDIYDTYRQETVTLVDDFIKGAINAKQNN